MKRTELRRKTPIPRGEFSLRRSAPLQAGEGSFTRRAPLRGRSVKLAASMRAYGPEVGAFLAAHPSCEFPLGCTAPSVDVHHTNGRNGARLRDQRFWKAACRFHNDYAETETGHSLAIGWLRRINTKGADVA